MNNDLYQTIEELKDTLASIDSARKQVSDTVAAYSETQNGIQNYVEKIDGIESGLKKMIFLLQNKKVIIEQQASSAVANLQTTCDEIAEKIKKEQETISRSFFEKLSSKLQEVESLVNAFDISVKRAESLTENIKETSDNVANIVQTIKNIRQELASSQKDQDAVLGCIEENVSSLTESCGEQANRLNEEINSKATNLQNSINQLKVCNESLMQKLTDNQSTLLKYFGEMNAEISKSKADMEKQVRTNRNFSFVAIALLLILVALHFIA